MLSTSVEVYLFKARSAVDKRPPRSLAWGAHTLLNLLRQVKRSAARLPRNGARRLLRLNDASSSTLEG